MEPRQLLEQIRTRVGATVEEVTFAHYLEMVAEDPRLARLSHALISDMVEASGISVGPDGEERFDLFEGELFGQQHVIQQIADYFRAAGRRLDVRKRILLLVGPPGSGKSTLVNTMKNGLEAYTHTDDGRVYAVKGSQMHEDPLRMIPEDLRSEAGVYIEGDLNPEVRWMLETTYKGDVGKVPIERVYYSIAHGVGFGTFVATDPRSEDLTRLVGEGDLSQLNPADPPAAPSSSTANSMQPIAAWPTCSRSSKWMSGSSPSCSASARSRSSRPAAREPCTPTRWSSLKATLPSTRSWSTTPAPRRCSTVSSW